MKLVRTARQAASWFVARLDIRSERGATAVEYGLMIALIAAVIIVAVFFLGRKTSETFSCVGKSIENKGPDC